MHHLEGYTFIVTEKPDAANRIAIALDIDGKPKRKLENGVPYYEAIRGGKLVIVPALGHLYTVSAAVRGKYPVFDYEWVPRYKAERKASRIRVWLQTIAKLAEKADAFIDACDYDIEGSIIGYCILKYTCSGKEKEAKRMKYSTLTEEELQKSFASPLPHLDFGLIEAGLARHEVDWLYGINLSRALTSAAKNYSNQYATLSTGRVQGPTLKFLALREKRIASFVPQPYWTIKAKVKVGNAVLEAFHEKSAFTVKQEAEAVVERCRRNTGVVEAVEKTRLQQSPPCPFDLGSLQSEAYRIFGYTPIRTSGAAQKLYLDALISYPRTSSQKLPQSIGYERILKNLAKNRAYTTLAGELLAKPELKPVEGKKTDSAHPAIFPTGKLPQKSLVGAEKNVYDLVVRRFMAAFGEPALRETVTATLTIEGEGFLLNGKKTLREGWLCVYAPFIRLQDTSLPEMTPGEPVQVKKLIMEDKVTKPPARYNPRSLLRKMEQGNIGTKATRAGIIQTLCDRKYIHEKPMAVTDLGFEVTDVLRKYCPSVVSVDFTRQLEEKMTQVKQGQKTKAEIISDAIEILKPVTVSLKENEKAVGEQLSRAVSKAKLEERVIGKCPTCQSGSLIVQYSKKTGKRFVGCTNYFNGTCKTAFPLPQRGYVKPSGKPCRSCGWFTVKVWLKGKRSWNLCFNPECSAKKSAGRKK
ncbi:MAG: DNA topoisomerase I [Candidatus Bathyarchaeota archaeon]|nr:DNA topoisomerase I [Candidatus Bathyarchaeota archaeon]